MLERERVRHWLGKAQDPEVAGALEAVYEDLNREIAKRAPVCWASGRCCKFESYGHRLYATGLETAYTVARLEKPLVRSALERAVDEGGCPFQDRNLCTVHGIKPLGCRVYFCDRSAQDWLLEHAERLQSLIARVHDEHDVEYHYAEWRSLLAQFALD